MKDIVFRVMKGKRVKEVSLLRKPYPGRLFLENYYDTIYKGNNLIFP